MGTYPDISLAEARIECAELRAIVAGGQDPSARPDEEEQDEAPPPPALTMPTFEQIAREWHAINKPRWKPSHAEHVLDTLVSEVSCAGLPVDRSDHRSTVPRGAASDPGRGATWRLPRTDRTPAGRARTTSAPARNHGALPSHLPRYEVVIDVAHEACPCCGGQMHCIGELRTEQLDVVQVQLRVRVTRSEDIRVNIRLRR